MAEAKQDKVLSNVFNKKLVNAIDKTFWKVYSRNDSQYVTGYDKIIVPQFLDLIPQRDVTGATDWNTRPLTTITHTSKEYGINTRQFGPILVTVLDQEELLYDKANTIMDEMMDDVDEYVSEYLTYNWTSVATNNIVPTTGTSTRSNRVGNTVKVMTYEDFLKANTILDEQKVPRKGRVFIGNSRFHQDIKLMGAFDNSDLLKTEILSKGEVAMLDGVKIISRESDNVFALGGTALQPFGTTPINTDLMYGILYHPDYVTHAVGTDSTKGGAKFIIRYPQGVAGQPTFEAYVRAGGTIAYEGDATNDTGVVSIVESV